MLNTPPILMKNAYKTERNIMYIVVIISLHNGHGIVVDEKHFCSFNELSCYLKHVDINISPDTMFPYIAVRGDKMYEVFVET